MHEYVLQIIGASGNNSRSLIVGDRSVISQLVDAFKSALRDGAAECVFRFFDGDRRVVIVLVGSTVEDDVPPLVDSSRFPHDSTTEAYQNTDRATTQDGLTMLRLDEVLAICKLSRSSVYNLIQNSDFPPPVKLSSRSSTWVQSEVLDWVRGRMRARQERLILPTKPSGKTKKPQF